MGDFLTLSGEDRSAVKEAVLRNLRSGDVAVLASDAVPLAGIAASAKTTSP